MEPAQEYKQLKVRQIVCKILIHKWHEHGKKSMMMMPWTEMYALIWMKSSKYCTTYERFKYSIYGQNARCVLLDSRIWEMMFAKPDWLLALYFRSFSRKCMTFLVYSFSILFCFVFICFFLIRRIFLAARIGY